MEQKGIPVTMANLNIDRNREEKMRQERMRYEKVLEEAAAQKAREKNKGKARGVEEEYDDEETDEEDGECLPGRSGAASAAFGDLRPNPGSAPVHLIEPVQWVNQLMVQLVNHQLVFTSQRRLVTGQCRSATGQRWPTAVKVFFF
ncbi:hypothetical protein PIB30_064908 [Stylosanthes scabra]|uniref:Uncharacterized protein n=1 Tax=Stylosanthes scabra TaxID=79078 RepID=A0ABU6RLT1_9FABA|nr:hypothetical protein [Stylosanthes scabra]